MTRLGECAHKDWAKNEDDARRAFHFPSLPPFHRRASDVPAPRATIPSGAPVSSAATRGVNGQSKIGNRPSAIRPRLSLFSLLLLCAVVAAPGQNISSLPALLHLGDLVNRVPVGLVPNSGDGPKGIQLADFDRDGTNDLAVSNTDGSVTVLFGTGNGRFSAPFHLRTPPTSATAMPGSLRGIVAADFDGDTYPDIATAAPSEGKVFLFFHTPGPSRFTSPRVLETWRGARNLEVGDFDGDQRVDLAVAGPNNGLRQYRGLGNGTFTLVVTNVPELDFSFAAPEKFPKPYYSLQRFRAPGNSNDWLVAGHAESATLWILKPDAAGTLRIASSVTGSAMVHGMAVGPVRHPAASGTNDLVTVLRDAGMLEVRKATNNLLDFGSERLSLVVPGGPRAVSIVDLNNDGWNDLVVVLRNFDAVVTYLNVGGTNFTPAFSRPVGSSPRELVTADFNGDLRPDAAVMNRGSSDVTILLAAEESAGYRAVDGLYLVDGQVAGLSVLDFNNDGFDDVIQLHRASGDFSVRLTMPDGSGRLQDSVFYTVGNVPAAQVLRDLNSDGLPDVVTANLGTKVIERGSVSIRLGQTNAPGMLGPETRIELPPEIDGRLFALEPGDFNRDGALDLVVGTLDGKLVFFQGGGDGSFAITRTRRILVDGSTSAQPRSLMAKDLDGDDDLDLAGVDATGETWVMENPWSPAHPERHLLSESGVAVRRFARPEDGVFSGRKLIAIDYNNDQRMDLIVGSGHAAWFYEGLSGPGATNFVTPPVRLGGISNLLSDFFLKDLDNDGNDDLIISCRDRDCLSFFSKTNRQSANSLSRGLPFDAPSSRFLATGDLDGDGQADLVGSGRILWTALSSRKPHDVPPLVPSGQRPRLSQVVINEILASNTDLPLKEDGNRMTDWIELHNGSASAQNLSGWKLSLEQTNEAGVMVVKNYAFPATGFIAGGAPLLLVCSESTNRSFYHTGFTLPASRGTLVLRDGGGNVVDRVTYPPQRPNISYARYRDALRSFVFNPYPSPNRQNPVNGTAEPSLKFAGVDPSSFGADQPIRFFAEVADDIGAVASLIMHYETLTWNPMSPRRWIQLFDDGQHGDGAPNDGLFAGELPFRLNSPTELQFFFELTDLTDTTVVAPEDPEFGTPDALGSAYQLGFVQPRPPLEISEILAWNKTGLEDGTNGYPDWVEIRNLSSNAVSLQGVALSQQMGDTPRLRFIAGQSLAAGQHLVVFCDNNPDLGTNHAPIALNRDGDTVMLTGLTTNGSRVLIDFVQFGGQEADVAWARLGARGEFWALTPTPANQNIVPRIESEVNRGWVGRIRSLAGVPEGLVAIPTQSGVPCTVEFKNDLNHAWIPLDQFVGDGIERVYTRPLSGATFYRWR